MSTTITLGKLRFDWRGDFTLTNSYDVNDIVTYRSQQYISILANPVGTAGDRTPLNATYWTLFSSNFNNRGTWATTTSYVKGDIVNFNTPGALRPTNTNFTLSRSVLQTYICTTTHTSTSTITPIDAGYWSPFNRKGTLGLQTGVGETTGAYQLGVYGNSNYNALTFANRGITFDANPCYFGGGSKNTVDSCGGVGVITQNGQGITFGVSANSGSGALFNMHAQTVLTFPFYDFMRSTSMGGTGIHSTPDDQSPRIIQWEQSFAGATVLMNSGEVFSWGYNAEYENGDNTATTRAYPIRVGGTLATVAAGTHTFATTRIKRIACGGSTGDQSSIRHTLALDENGNVWSWGYNGYGQLGVGNTTTWQVPQMISRSAFATVANPSGQSVIAIWAGGNQYGYSYAVTQDNQLWVWGYNGSGQLGIAAADTTQRTSPTLISSVAFGTPSVGNIIKIQTADNSSTDTAVAILTSKGYIYTTGRNVSGWMGNGNTTGKEVWTNMGSGPGNVANGTAYDMWIYGAGGTYAALMVRDTTGTCYTVGYNSTGALGLGGTGTTSTSTISATSKMQIAGTPYDLKYVKQLAWIHQQGSVTTIAATVVTDNGFAFSIGYNSNGQTSNGTTGTYGGSLVDSNGIENINSYLWQPVRSAPGMQGKFDNCMGYGNWTTSCANLAWKNTDGRWMVSGDYRNIGSYHSENIGNSAHIMTTIPVA